ncbi:hypothetical protein [Streptomyces mirabilis]|uniref:hypothetical protein n=1 Tax=Streptomyces mirabilis TaxID=68239 RepID=UPI003F4CC85B
MSQVQHLVDQVGDEPGEMILGQPVVQRRGQQQDLMRVERPEPLVHRRRAPLRPPLPDRLDLEQPMPTTYTAIIPHE